MRPSSVVQKKTLDHGKPQRHRDRRENRATDFDPNFRRDQEFEASQIFRSGGLGLSLFGPAICSHLLWKKPKSMPRDGLQSTQIVFS